ncbi:hypothetical protein D3C77_517340 [compost metagenome]
MRVEFWLFCHNWRRNLGLQLSSLNNRRHCLGLGLNQLGTGLRVGDLAGNQIGIDQRRIRRLTACCRCAVLVFRQGFAAVGNFLLLGGGALAACNILASGLGLAAVLHIGWARRFVP